MESLISHFIISFYFYFLQRYFLFKQNSTTKRNLVSFSSQFFLTNCFLAEIKRFWQDKLEWKFYRTCVCSFGENWVQSLNHFLIRKWEYHIWKLSNTLDSNIFKTTYWYWFWNFTSDFNLLKSSLSCIKNYMFVVLFVKPADQAPLTNPFPPWKKGKKSTKHILYLVDQWQNFNQNLWFCLHLLLFQVVLLVLPYICVEVIVTSI